MTLMELLVTLAIMVILAFIGVPSYQQFVENERFAVATNELYKAYRFARNEAIKTSTPMTLEANPGGWANGWSVKDSSANVLFVSKKPRAGITVSGASITVFGRGALSGGNAAFSISSSSKARYLCVLSSGQSILQDGNCP